MKKQIFSSIIFLILLASLVHGMGFSQPKKARMIVEPGLSEVYGYGIIPTLDYTIDYLISKRGYLSEYITIEPDKIVALHPNETAGIKANITFPENLDIEELEPGLHEPYLWIEEDIASSSGITAKTAAMIKMEFLVLFEGKHLEIKTFEIPSINVNQSIIANLEVASYGKEDLDYARATIEVYDHEGALLTTFETDEKSISSTIIETLTGKSNYKLESGRYTAKATVFWDGGETSEMETNFKVGILDIKINSHTSEIESDKINEFNIKIESLWNNPTPNVYGIVYLDNKSFQSVSVTLLPWKTAGLTTYINTQGMAIGQHDLLIEIFSSEEKISSRESSINIIESQIGDEKKDKKPVDVTMTIIYVLIILVLLLAIINVLWMRKSRSKGK